MPEFIPFYAATATDGRRYHCRHWLVYGDVIKYRFFPLFNSQSLVPVFFFHFIFHSFSLDVL